MIGILPRLRLAGLGLPLLLGGCMSGILPGTEAADPTCLLLCALARDFTGEPTPQPPSDAPAQGKPIAAKPVTEQGTVKPRRPAKPRAVAAVAPRSSVGSAHPRPVRPVARAQVSVVPQSSAREAAPKPAAMVPSGPVPVAVTPSPLSTEPARSLSQSIPGSVDIVPQGWRGP